MDIHPKVIDIYHEDRVTSFEEAHAFGIRGVIHKASEGTAVFDHLYPQRRQAAGAAGMLWGAYHFLRPSGTKPGLWQRGSIESQADFFIKSADPTPDTLLAADHEEERGTFPLLVELCAFIEAVEGKLNRPNAVVIYSGSLLKEQILDASAAQKEFLGTHRLWLPQYSLIPKWPAIWKKPWLWQFTGDGMGPKPHAVPGIQDKMDINSFDGTDEDLAKEWADGPKAAAIA